MNARNLILCLVVTLLSLGATSAYAQMSSTELIVASVAPGQPIELYFPNLESDLHPKDLIFQGSFTNIFSSQNRVEFWFDWQDASGATFNSPAVSILLQPGEIQSYGLPGSNRPPLTFTIPFCPPRVSIHFEIEPTPVAGGAVLVDGQFTHICRVPEPSSVLLAGLSLAGVGVVALRRRRS